MTTSPPADSATLDRLRTSPVTARYFTADGHLVDVRGGDGPTDPPAEPPAPAEPPSPTPSPEPTPPPAEDPARLPDDHPLVTAFQRAKADLAEARRKTDEAAEAARLAALSDADRRVEEARLAGKEEATKGFGAVLAAAKIEAALTGIVPDPAAIVEDLNVARYLTEAGEVDTAKVAELRAKYVALAKAPTAGSADGGPQGNPPPQKSLDDQIAEARAAGNTALAISLNNQKLAALAVPQ